MTPPELGEPMVKSSALSHMAVFSVAEGSFLHPAVSPTVQTGRI